MSRVKPIQYGPFERGIKLDDKYSCLYITVGSIRFHSIPFHYVKRHLNPWRPNKLYCPIQRKDQKFMRAFRCFTSSRNPLFPKPILCFFWNMVFMGYETNRRVFASRDFNDVISSCETSYRYKGDSRNRYVSWVETEFLYHSRFYFVHHSFRYSGFAIVNLEKVSNTGEN